MHPISSRTPPASCPRTQPPPPRPPAAAPPPPPPAATTAAARSASARPAAFDFHRPIARPPTVTIGLIQPLSRTFGACASGTTNSAILPAQRVGVERAQQARRRVGRPPGRRVQAPPSRQPRAARRRSIPARPARRAAAAPPTAPGRRRSRARGHAGSGAPARPAPARDRPRPASLPDCAPSQSRVSTNAWRAADHRPAHRRAPQCHVRNSRCTSDSPFVSIPRPASISLNASRVIGPSSSAPLDQADGPLSAGAGEPAPLQPPFAGVASVGPVSPSSHA